MPPWSRRRYLQLVGTAASITVAGCSGGGETTTDTSDTTDTTATTPTTDTETQTTTESTVVSTEWTTTDLDGAVTDLWLPNRPPAPSRTGGPLYASTTNGQVASLIVGSGEVEWTASVEGHSSDRSHPVVFEGEQHVYAISQTWNEETQRNYVEAFEPESDERNWLWDAGEFLTPLGEAQGTFFVRGHTIKGGPSELGVEVDPSGEGNLHALDAGTGEERWSLEYPNLRDTAFADHGVYVVTDDASVGDPPVITALDHDGTKRWSTEAIGDSLHPIRSVKEGLLVWGNEGLEFYAPEEDSPVWTVDEWVSGPDSLTVEMMGPYEDTIFAGPEPLLALSLEGEERWRRTPGGSVLAGARTPIYVDGPADVQGVDPASGEQLFRYLPDNAEAVEALAAVDDAALVAHRVWTDTEFGVVSEDGSQRELVVTPAPYNAMITMRSRVYVGTDSGITAYLVNP